MMKITTDQNHYAAVEYGGCSFPISFAFVLQNNATRPCNHWPELGNLKVNLSILMNASALDTGK